jgi:hypothetical protein
VGRLAAAGEALIRSARVAADAPFEFLMTTDEDERIISRGPLGFKNRSDI